VDDLVKALGMSGMSKSQVSRLCHTLDGEVERFRTRKLDGTYAYVQLDATFVKVRQEHRVVSMAVVIAVGVNQDGQREVPFCAAWLRAASAACSRAPAGSVAVHI
jgi:transposase-like protein